MSSGRTFRPWRRRARAVAGFTLVEMMITVAIAAILAALALPSFREFMIRQNTIEITNDLVGALNTARIEAVKRGVAVRVSPAGGGWSAGWTVSADTTHDDTFATAVTAHAAIPATYTIQGLSSEGGADVVFGATGALRPRASTFNFNVCRPASAADSTQSRRVAIESGGAVSTHRDVNSPAITGLSC